jgi:hypothetical protein
VPYRDWRFRIQDIVRAIFAIQTRVAGILQLLVVNNLDLLVIELRLIYALRHEQFKQVSTTVRPCVTKP